MAEPDVTKAEDSAEKAYAAASEAVAPQDLPATEESAQPVEFPAKPNRALTPETASAADAPAVAPVAPAVAKPPLARAAKPAKAPKPAAKRAVKPQVPAAPVAAKTATAKTAPVKTAPVKAATVKAATAKSAPIKARKASVKIKTAPKAAPATVSARTAAPSIPFIAKIKELPMDMTASIKDAVSGAQEKAKEAFSKTSAAASEYGEFAKGNVEAFVESGKILASGLQELGTTFVADSKSAFETATADVKALASVKSPTDLFKLQTEILRRNFDTAIAYGAKNGEAVAKLTSDVIAPISGRVSLAVEKVKAAA